MQGASTKPSRPASLEASLLGFMYYFCFFRYFTETIPNFV